jgi:hypothetical protein
MTDKEKDKEILHEKWIANETQKILPELKKIWMKEKAFADIDKIKAAVRERGPEDGITGEVLAAAVLGRITRTNGILTDEQKEFNRTVMTRLDTIALQINDEYHTMEEFETSINSNTKLAELAGGALNRRGRRRLGRLTEQNTTTKSLPNIKKWSEQKMTQLVRSGNVEAAEFVSSLSSLKIFDEHLGIRIEFLQGKCFNCNNKSLLFLDENNFYCMSCAISKAQFPYMKKFVVDFNKVRDRIARHPDEEMANIAQHMKSTTQHFRI